MNFLAHIYLSHQDNEEMVGNFIGDFVKGRNFSHYPEKIAKGIRLHRDIDHYTDNHPTFKESVDVIRPYCGRYAGIAVDVYYDYFLAKDWQKYHNEPLSSFSEHFYKHLAFHLEDVPEKVQSMFPYMKKDNWLLKYATYYGIDRSLNGINRRTGGKAGIDKGIEWLKEHEGTLQVQFDDFFPDLIHFTEKARQK